MPYNLDLIDPNPWQTRDHEDPEHVKKIAESIKQIGMLQIPVGRQVDGRVQLAFGHTRQDPEMAQETQRTGSRCRRKNS